MAPLAGSATSFADLAYLTQLADCVTQGASLDTCDPYGRPYTPYGLIPAHIFSALGIGLNNTGSIGLILALLFIVTIAILSLVMVRNWRASTASLIVAEFVLGVASITAPVLLGIERGQIELLILLLVVVAILMLATNSTVSRSLGAVLGVVATVIKYLTVGMFLPFIRRGSPNIPALIGVLLSVLFLILSFQNLQLASSTSRADLPTTTKSAFGAAPALATFFTSDPIGYQPVAWTADNWPAMRLAGALLFIAVAIISALLIRRSQMEELLDIPTAWGLLLGSAGVLVLPYLLGASHDYRLIFLLPMVVGALIWLSTCTGPAKVLPLVVLIGALAALLTGAAMIPTPAGLIWPKFMLVIGDIGLLLALAISAGLLLRQWVPARVPQTPASN